MEREAEIEEFDELFKKNSVRELEKLGLCISKLTPDQVQTGLYGKILVEFKLPPFKKNYDMSKFSNGDIVGVIDAHTQPSSKTEISGIVYKTSPSSITVSFKEYYEFDQMAMPLSLVMLPNDVTYH